MLSSSMRHVGGVRALWCRSTTRSFGSASSDLPRVGFVGLGNMGKHMAMNLRKHNYPLTVFDLNTQAVKDLTDKGAKSAQSPAQVASESQIVVTMLPASAHVVQVYTDEENGILRAAQQGSLLIDSSTIDPITSRKVAELAREHGTNMIDAPVSGGVLGAEAGTLTFMVGADSPEIFSSAEPLLKCMGKNVVHCGPAGTGQVAKVCNNLVLAISMIGVSEGMNLGARLGMDPAKLASIFNTSTARCWSSDSYNPHPGVMDGVPSSRGYTGGFATALMKKDLGLAVDAAKECGSNLPLGAMAHQLFSLMCAYGHQGKDFSSVFEFIRGLQDSNTPPKSH